MEEVELSSPADLDSSELRGFLLQGDLVGDSWGGLDIWEQRTPCAVTSTMTPSCSALGLGQVWLKSSMEAAGDKAAGLKSSGVLEETDGGVWVSLGGAKSGLDADWTPCLPLRTRAWLRVQVLRYWVLVDGGGSGSV